MSRYEAGKLCMAPSVRTETVDKALRLFVMYEIGYGGYVVNFSDTRLEVVTNILSKVDKTLFEGSKEDMALLLEAAAVSVVTRPFSPFVTPEYNDAMVEVVMEFTQGRPNLIAMASGMLMGNFSIKAVLVTLLGADESQTEEILNLNPKSQDLLDLVTFVRLQNMPLAEAMEYLK
jgi:hypothetical protein